MFGRALLILAVFAGLLGGQLESRGLCVEKSAAICGGCCAPDSTASCCHASDAPTPPVTAPNTSGAPDWKVIGPVVVLLLPRSFEREALKPIVVTEAPRANGLARIERTCVRLI